MATPGADWIQRKPIADGERHRIRLALLREVLNFGSHVPTWYIDKVSTMPNAGLLIVPGLLLRRVLESLAAIESHVENALPSPIAAPLRTMFEAHLGLKHVLADPSVDRCAAYIVWHEKQTLRTIAMWEANVGSVGAGDPHGLMVLSDIHGPRQAEVAEAKSQAEALLRAPRLTSAVKEYERLKKKHNRHPQWYALFGGEPNVERLARAHASLGLYLAAYGLWSRQVHGTELLLNNVVVRAGEALLHPLHGTAGMDAQVLYAVSLTLRSIFDLTSARMTERIPAMADWYKLSVAPMYRAIMSGSTMREKT